MADSTIEEAVRSPGVEIFGIHELVLNTSNKSGYKDVYPLQRKKRPWQAKVWDAARQSHVSLGSFGTPREAAVAVATARTTGLENLPSPDKSRAARGSGGAHPPHSRCPSSCLSLLIPHSSVSRVAQGSESSRRSLSPPPRRLRSTTSPSRPRRCPWRRCSRSEPQSASGPLLHARPQPSHSHG